MNKNILCLMLGLTATSLAFGQAGERGNGSGGRADVSKNWHPANELGAMIAGAKEFDSQRKLLDFAEKNPSVKITLCDGKKKIGYPEFPKALAGQFQLSVEGKSVSRNELCQSPAYVNAYTQFALTLYDYLAQYPDSIYLINAAYEQNHQAIPVVFKKNPERIGKIIEYTSFDPSRGEIHFAEVPPASLINSMMAAGVRHFIRHEVAHVLLYRALGKNYPRVSKWHDTKTNQTNQLFDFSWIQNKTSPEAAFIESFAQVMEQDQYALEHQYMFTHSGDFMEVNLGDGCFYAPLQVFKQSGSKWSAPLDNEIYVASAMHVLLEDLSYNPNSAKAGDAVEKPFDFKVGYNRARYQALIKAAQEVREPSVLALAESLMKGDQAKIARHWYFEYFFTDLKTNENLADLATVRKTTKSFAFQTQVCLNDKKDIKRTVTAFRTSEQNKIRARGNAERAMQISDSQLDQVSQKLVQRCENEASQSNAISNAMQVIKNYVKSLNGCQGSKLKLKEGSIIEKLADMRLENPIAEMESYGVLAETCNPQAAGASNWSVLLEKAREISRESTTPGTEIHIKRINAYRNLLSQVNDLAKNAAIRIRLANEISKLK